MSLREISKHPVTNHLHIIQNHKFLPVYVRKKTDFK